MSSQTDFASQYFNYQFCTLAVLAWPLACLRLCRCLWAAGSLSYTWKPQTRVYLSANSTGLRAGLPQKSFPLPVSLLLSFKGPQAVGLASISDLALKLPFEARY